MVVYWTIKIIINHTNTVLKMGSYFLVAHSHLLLEVVEKNSWTVVCWAVEQLASQTVEQLLAWTPNKTVSLLNIQLIKTWILNHQQTFKNSMLERIQNTFHSLGFVKLHCNLLRYKATGSNCCNDKTHCNDCFKIRGTEKDLTSKVVELNFRLCQTWCRTEGPNRPVFVTFYFFGN